MSERALIVVALLVASLIEGGNGLAFALRGKKTLSSAGLSYHDGPGLLIQEFGVYIGDAKPMLGWRSERNQGLVHAASIVILSVVFVVAR